eukprot:TRINITY_DN2421_c0_g1_i5.p1 TRINITY_DN2421_c0_g1~~TRINITY_DN2421_c0_g1_i5.p1  ORF type:complete len:382 (-),score=52.20 TRINITY_DN2421_c0_g1_i5:83-1228(-)
MEFTKTFLMTYHTFTTPEKFLHKLIERYYVPISKKPPDVSKETWETSVMKAIQIRVCNVLRKWIDVFEDELTNTRLLKKLKGFIENVLIPDGHNVLATAMTNSLARHLDSTNKGVVPTLSEQPPEPKVPRLIFSPQLTIHDIHEEELARQLCLIVWEFYSAIKPSELLNQSWSKSKQRHRSPNVLNMIWRFNRISQWVSTCIIECDRIRIRARVLAKFIRTAEHLRRMNNFDTLTAVVAGMTTSAVYRLKWTSEEVGRQLQTSLKTLEKVMSSAGAFKAYRSNLKNANPPVIPYIGIFLTDLTFVDDGNPDYSNNLINFTKRSLVHNIIAQIQQYQLLPYNYHPIHQIQQYIKKYPILEENEMFAKSLELEPRKAERHEIL